MKNKDESMIELLQNELIIKEKIIKSLMSKVENSIASRDNAFSLFENNVVLQQKILIRTDELNSRNEELEKAKQRIEDIADYNLKVINSLKEYLFVCYDDLVIVDGNKRFSALLNGLSYKNVSVGNIIKLHQEINFLSIIEQTKVDKYVEYFEIKVDLDGSPRYVNLSATLIEDALEHKKSRYVFILKDVSEHVEMKEQLEKERLITIQSSKLASLGEMAGGIAHEINNPLTIIYSSLLILRKELKKDPFSMDVLMDKVQVIENTVMRISKIVSGLRTLTRKSDGMDLEEHLVLEVLDEVTLLCGERLKASSIELSIDVEPNDLKIKCDEVQFSQVLLNLLSNAIDAIAESPHEKKWIKIIGKKKANNVILQIVDSGVGVNQGIKNEIFNPFFTSKEIGKGTGLGLSLSKTIIEKHNGQIYLDNKSMNTCFVIKLPFSNIYSEAI